MRLALCLLALASLAAAQNAIEEGRALLDGPDREKGIARIREGIAAAEKETPTAGTMHRIGLGWFYLEEDAKAEAAFAKAAELDPKEPEHVFMRGVVQMYGDPAKATATMRKAVELGPTSAKYRCELGRLLARQGQYEEALATTLEACRIAPKNAEAHHQAATLLVGAGKEEEAVPHLKTAVENDPKLVDAWFNLGQVSYNRGRHDEALAAWTKAAELVPDDFQTRTKLVQALYALGRYADAEPHRKRVLELRPEGREEFCFDQFDVGENRVFAYEAFDKGGDLYYHFTFRVTSPKGEILETINLESSAVLRENGGMYILGRNRRDGHGNFGLGWRELPPYAELKALVVKAAKGELDR
ncbi:MAG: tetratricopeptide repeat protein [Planctomycetota bacterium]